MFKLTTSVCRVSRGYSQKKLNLESFDFKVWFCPLVDLPTKDICGVSQSELSHAYIVSPSFPNVLKNGLNCECTLISNYENGQILLRRVDMKVSLYLILIASKMTIHLKYNRSNSCLCSSQAITIIRNATAPIWKF